MVYTDFMSKTQKLVSTHSFRHNTSTLCNKTYILHKIINKYYCDASGNVAGDTLMLAKRYGNDEMQLNNTGLSCSATEKLFSHNNNTYL